MPINVNRSGTGNVTVLRLIGEYDIANVVGVRRALADVAGATLVVLDLAECAFLDSTILGAFVGAGKRIGAAGSRLVAVNATGIAAKALHITGLDTFLALPPDLDDEFRTALQELNIACFTGSGLPTPLCRQSDPHLSRPVVTGLQTALDSPHKTDA